MQVAHLAVWRTAAAAGTHPWQQYSAADSRRILQAAATGQGTVTLTALDGSRCDVDLSSMQATHRCGGSSSPAPRDVQDTCVICQTGAMANPHKLPWWYCTVLYCMRCTVLLCTVLMYCTVLYCTLRM